MRLIDADALIKDLDAIAICVPMFKARKSKRTIVGEAAYRTFYIFMEHINNAPTIEMRPKGKWLGDEDELTDFEEHEVRCSVCGSDMVLYDDNPPKFCIDCGAEMDGYMCCSSIEDEERI